MKHRAISKSRVRSGCHSADRQRSGKYNFYRSKSNSEWGAVHGSGSGNLTWYKSGSGQILFGSSQIFR